VAKRRRKPKKRRTPQAKNKLRAVQLVEYEITSEPMLDRWYKHLPEHLKDAMDRLHSEAQRHPQKAIPELVDLIQKYPNIPMLYNFLSVAYSQAGDREKAKEVVLENYRRNPDYLFARLNYAEICRLEGDYEQIAEIFEYKFDLKLLYPDRKRFHISEVASFMGLIGIYFFETGKQEIAEKYYEILKELAPDYPMTRLLRRKLHPSPFGQILKRMPGRKDSE
jgi:tetratricopeptide (TPR) repeat protein